MRTRLEGQVVTRSRGPWRCVGFVSRLQGTRPGDWMGTEPGRCRDMTAAISSLISPLSVPVSLSFDLAWLVCSHHLSEIPCACRKWPQNHTKHERFCAENMEQLAAQLWAKSLVLSRTPTPDAAWYFAERCQGHPLVARERHRGASKRCACRSAHAVRRSRDHIRAGDESPPRNWLIACAYDYHLASLPRSFQAPPHCQFYLSCGVATLFEW